jgi:glycosyltransferase involved in cell wall biosynthesis
MPPIRLLFLPLVDAENTNAQSLNTREIALRLDPAKFECTLFYATAPDERLRNNSHIRLLKLPARMRTVRILRELFGSYDIAAYMDYSPASYMFLHWPGRAGRRAKAVYHAEAPAAQMVNPSRLQRFLAQANISRCDVHTGITPYVARDIGRRLNRQVPYILPVGVDSKMFYPPPARKANTVPTVLFTGTLIERKGPQLVLQAAARFAGAKFRLIGAGREGYEEVLRRKIADRGLTNTVLEGSQPQRKIAQAMRESDIFLLPSRLEGLPKVTLEAAASGLPCVVFRDYETPSVVDGVTGYQVSTEDEMMERLAQLIAEEGLRRTMGESARQHAARFDWDAVARQWQAAYWSIATPGQ